MKYDLVIFDCDGTLVDSEYLNHKITSELLAEHGFPQFDLQYSFEHFTGMKMVNVVKRVFDETGEHLPADFVDVYIARVSAAMPSLLKKIEGAEDIVQKAGALAKICVASNGERNNVLSSLTLTGLKPYFIDDHIFTAAMVENPKPAPDLFLLAAETMGVAPGRTLVIEDSITGVMAAKAAGTDVIGFTGGGHTQDDTAGKLRDAGAEIVISTMGDLPDLWM